MQDSAQIPLRVGLVALPETAPACLYGLQEVLSSVGTIWPMLTGEPEPGRRIEALFVSSTLDMFTGASGAPIAPQASFDDFGQAEIVIVPDLYLDPSEDPRGRWRDVGEWLRAQHDGGATVTAVCTGALLLAATGLLSGHQATTHWAAVDTFRRCFPDVTLRADRVLVTSGPDNRVVTSGGSASWEDLALYLIARFCGQAQAVHAAKIFLLGDRSEGQLPYAAMTRPRHHDDAAIAACQAWIADNYAEDRAVSAMAVQSGLPLRTFKRRFRAATGYAPMEYVQTLRVEEAKQLLETTDATTDSIAREVGYGDPTFFRRLFKRCTGVTPSRYRQRFRTLARV